MNTFLLAFLSLALLLGALIFACVPSVASWRRAALASALAVILAILFFGYSDMLGRPKSTRLEVLRMNTVDAVVLDAVAKEGHGVYLWLQLPGIDEPRYYKLPWDMRTAKALEDALQENARRHGPGIGLSLPFEHSWDTESPKFYPLPQPKFPDKPGEPEPRIYRAPSQGA